MPHLVLGQPYQAPSAPDYNQHVSYFYNSRKPSNLGHYLDIGALSISGHAHPAKCLKEEEFNTIKDKLNNILQLIFLPFQGRLPITLNEHVHGSLLLYQHSEELIQWHARMYSKMDHCHISY